MGSHYIKVGKLNVNIDQEFLDVLCPAAGFTPELICTVENGYIPDPTVFVPPIEIGTPAAEEILLLCTNESPGVISLKTKITDNTQYKVRIYDDSNSEIHNENINSNAAFTYYFPDGALQYFKVRISPATAGKTIDIFYTYNPLTGYNYDWPILQAKFNTPNITSLENAFRSIKKLRSIVFDCTLDYLTSFKYTFSEGGLLKFIFPENMLALTTVERMFYNNLSVMEVDMYNSVCPELLSLLYMCGSANGNKLSKFRFPSAGLPKATTISGIHYKSSVSGDMVIPNMPLLTVASLSFQYTTLLNSLKWDGTFASMPAAAYDNHVQYSGISTFEYPRWMNSFSQNIENNNFIKNIRLPDVVVGKDGGTAWLEQQGYKETISGDCDNSGAATQLFLGMGQCYNLRSVNCPKMRCRTLQLTAKSYFTSCVIDYANSSFSDAGNVVLRGGLSATEINRIFSELPAMTKNIDVTTNPGYATCDPSIATAKGWTVV